jgi:stalled ribosome rescue protein Dom34
MGESYQEEQQRQAKRDVIMEDLARTLQYVTPQRKIVLVAPSEESAREFLEDFRRRYPEVVKFMEEQETQIKVKVL